MKRSVLLFCVFSLLLVSGQSYAKNNFPVFLTKTQSVAFKFPPGWYKNTEENPYDLQCFSKDMSGSTGVFEFFAEDLAEGFQAQDIFELQIADIQGKRKNFKPFSDRKTFDTKDKVVTTQVYSAEKDRSRDLYIFSLIEFKQTGTVVVVLQTSLPSKWKNNHAIFHRIVMSAKSR